VEGVLIGLGEGQEMVEVDEEEEVMEVEAKINEMQWWQIMEEEVVIMEVDMRMRI